MKHVEKVWGYENWIVNNELYCMKRLILNPGFQCSLHRHAIKDETFFIEEGSVYLEIGDEVKFLMEGDAARIHPLTWHRFANREQNHAVILEVSTHHDDGDVERKEESRKI